MIRIGILGDIGSGKSYVAKKFGYPVFNADYEVSKLYKNNKKIFHKLKKKLPKYVTKFPIDKNEIIQAILAKKKNLKLIINIVHREIKVKLKLFFKKNKNKKAIILDIPLLLENKINKKGDILIFIDAKKKEINKRLKKKHASNHKFLRKFQLPVEIKKKKSDFIIQTNKGKINLTLHEKEAPVTVANFINLCQRDYYQNLPFHRVIDEFMIQGGCPLGSGVGGPGYQFEDECCPELAHDKPGILSMANAGPNTNGSQFFITHVPTPWLDGNHTVFGEVLNEADQEVVNQIEQGDVIEQIEIKSGHYIFCDHDGIVLVTEASKTNLRNSIS